jgi:hypothetical protein
VGTLPGVYFIAIGTPGPPASVIKRSGDNQIADAGTRLLEPPTVTLFDSYGNPVYGAQVIFSVGSGGGSITGAVQTTTDFGHAAVGTWTLGPTPGLNTLNVNVGSLPTITFSATAQ